MTQRPPHRFLAALFWLFSSRCQAVPYPDLFPPLNGTKATTILDDMPGCACQGHWCQEEERTHFSYSDEEMDHVATCPFLGSAYGFFDIQSSGLICDELQANVDFRRSYGDLGNIGILSEEMTEDIYYYNAGQHLIRVESGNCQTAYQRQQQCYTDSKEYYSTARWYPPHPTSCIAWDYSLPTTDSKLKIASACLSSFENVDSPKDDRWLLYASWANQDIQDLETPPPIPDFCPSYNDVETPEARTAQLMENRSSYLYFPIMGREDWIEPVEGRRYMGYDFVDDREEANEYCLLVLSLGYEPCHGSPTSSAASCRSSISVALLLAFGWMISFGF